MVFEFVQRVIAEKIGEEKAKCINIDFSFVNNSKINEHDFLDILELVEEEMEMNLVDYAGQFGDVRQLVEYICKKQ